MGQTSYRSKRVGETTQEELIFELLSRNRMNPLPVKKEFYAAGREITVAVGDDHVATIYIFDEDLKELSKRVGKHLPQLRKENSRT